MRISVIDQLTLGYRTAGKLTRDRRPGLG